MGYVVFKNIYEDENCVIYAYSHDSKIYDGVIKIQKVRYTPDNASGFDKYIEITPSSTDTSNNLFAMKTVVFLIKYCKKMFGNFLIIICLHMGEPNGR